MGFLHYESRVHRNSIHYGRWTRLNGKRRRGAVQPRSKSAGLYQNIKKGATVSLHSLPLSRHILPDAWISAKIKPLKDELVIAKLQNECQLRGNTSCYIPLGRSFAGRLFSFDYICPQGEIYAGMKGLEVES